MSQAAQKSAAAKNRWKSPWWQLASGLCLPLALTAIGCNSIVGIEKATLSKQESGCASSELTIPKELLSGCVYRVGCDPFQPPYTMSQCVSLSYQKTTAAGSCTYGASSCGDIENCIGRRYDDDAACTGKTSGWQCSSDQKVAYYCGKTPRYAVMCDQLGATCVPHDNMTAPQAFACKPTNAPSCEASDVEGQYHCSGNVLYTCLSGEPFGYDCSKTDSICNEDESGSAYCSERTDACGNKSSASCVGDNIQVCDSAGYAVKFDCSAAGLSCATDETDGPTCVADGCSTTDKCVEKCLDAKTMQFCVGKQPVTLDCTDYGFDGCTSDSWSSSQDYAYCAMASGNGYPGTTAQ